MIVLLLALSIVVTVAILIIAIKIDKYGDGFWDYLLFILSSIVSITMLCVIPFFINNAISIRYIDKKIAMYEEENAEIEERIDTLVKGYMEYESDTFSNFKVEDSMTLVSLYPELKADELVQKQMSIYSENNQKIKSLKEEKIDAAKSRWWLYFGN